MKTGVLGLTRSDLLIALLLSAVAASALGQTAATGELHVRISYRFSQAESRKPPAVVWLEPVAQTEAASLKPGRYTLLQKNRTFSPHILIVPVGSTVSFPNSDPFFHNVFSLFNGKRFDLGLYEAGASKDVVFSREGVSYVFCNIHSEMSAVIVSLATPYYAAADAGSNALIANVAPGEYEVHIWVEGFAENALQALRRRVRIRPGSSDQVAIELSEPLAPQQQHLDMYGQPYDRTPRSQY